MGWRLHHVHIPVQNIRENAAFYTRILGMQEEPFPYHSDGGIVTDRSSQTRAYFLDDSNCEVHMSRPTQRFSYDNHLFLHPTVSGHLAINVDDIDEVKEALHKEDVPFEDAGVWALKGYYQIYFYDTAMNVVEVNQRREE
jgi:catechol 2,3-dioxygenase-like lactoylglutathione lyase family enzyme